jgi:hypothetical protein
MDPIEDDNLNIADIAKQNSKNQANPEKQPLSRGRRLAAWDKKKLKLREQEAFRKELAKALESARSKSKTP